MDQQNHSNKENLPPEAAAPIGRTRNSSVSADPEEDNVAPLPDHSEPQGLQRQSDASLPPAEAASISTITLRLLVLSPHPLVETLGNLRSMPSVRLRAIQIGSLEEYRNAVRNNLDDAYYSGSRWLLHVLLVTADGRPVLGGIVHESDLYDCIPRNRRPDLEPQQVQQIQHSAAFSGLEVYRFTAQFSGWDSLNIYLERAVTSITEQHGVSNMVRLLQAVGFEFLLGTGIPRDFIKAILNSCKRHSANASSNIKIYLFISAHGSQDGFVLSDGTVVELPKLVNKLKKIASHVRVFYQACRGAYRHSVDELSTGLEGFSFEVFSFEDAATAGSSLPSLVPGCSALFASCPGHMAYSRPDTGGWMLQALHKVLEDCPRIRQTNLSSIEDFRQLANMVQRCMQDLVGGKPIKCEKTQSHGQIQFVLHLPE
uniref:CASPASE_P20 domain-containing protein n=1 Tax=Macrostomum lignano TaxID=282301 RepID=A0A1I8G4D9_9PLAT